MHFDSWNVTVNQVCGYGMLCCICGAEYAQPFLLAGNANSFLAICILVEIQMSHECVRLHRQMYCSLSCWAASCIRQNLTQLCAAEIWQSQE